ncbi:hypothetical protein COCNU_08G004920 [Cocos nucifera]|uniref:Secreted protein n=1 Tax=Cocos nucifera TaxID=13894 RepID=A0A8K0IIZ4_COCNU|nr:hypothetical protein COCNU_08G004920 [Cocos nucifera]
MNMMLTLTGCLTMSSLLSDVIAYSQSESTKCIGCCPTGVLLAKRTRRMVPVSEAANCIYTSVVSLGVVLVTVSAKGLV